MREKHWSTKRIMKKTKFTNTVEALPPFRKPDKRRWVMWDLCILALMMWREYRSGGRERMRACGHVAHNRSKGQQKPMHVIITADAQFTSINPPKKTYDPQLDVWPQISDVRFDEALELAEIIMDGSDKDPTGGALYYWNPKIATIGGWFERNIASSPYFEISLKSGLHVFYRPLPSCSDCGDVMIRTGSTFKCRNCGAQSGNS